MMLLLLCAFGFVLIELLYFRLADHYDIIDKPNQRSSHTQITLRGGGVLFPIAWMTWFFLSGFELPLFTAGLLLLSVVSFWDDVKTLGSTVRFGAQIVAFTLLFLELHIFQRFSVLGIMATYILCIACLNAINFMDGINGITGMYALVTLPFVFFGNETLLSSPVPMLILALLVFGFFNFRRKAKCFAGDVGSVSIGYILIGLILVGILHYSLNKNPLHGFDAEQHFDFSYILLLSVYGVDAMLTIFQRLRNKENILQPHRKHLYQYLANEMKWPHLLVASLYAGLQLLINFGLVSGIISGYGCWVALILLGVCYVLIKWRLHKKLFRAVGK
jgi:UDP-N-acetylmuramyl pentapeptide phosphotransferase/UDP-N-acetylglucosamine-1-phosphate transferase